MSGAWGIRREGRPTQVNPSQANANIAKPVNAPDTGGVDQMRKAIENVSRVQDNELISSISMMNYEPDPAVIRSALGR